MTHQGYRCPSPCTVKRYSETRLGRIGKLGVVTGPQTLAESSPRWKYHSDNKTQHTHSTSCHNENKGPIHPSKSIVLGKSLNVLTLLFGFCSSTSG
ncbi:hypothetical protein I79_016835 [Cricetulus griseus]|uniref:Uncharacterized protein n=1 Tax=Cricetulus griseus TaxID=10029 RepID=G3I0F3_CRIGR|nr:hypothetical protein I79_016835 [Cricetulus griseus]